MADWHNKHIGTQWGVAILGFFVIATGLLVAYANQPQVLSSHAMAKITPTVTPSATLAPVKCQIAKGTCQSMYLKCSGSKLSGQSYCANNSQVCCVPEVLQ